MAILFALPNLFSEQKISNFPSFIPSQKVNLGLDLQGGSHLLLEVDTASIKKEKIEDLTFDLRRMLKKDGVKYNNLKIINDRINFKLNDAPLLARLLSIASLTGIVDELQGDGISFSKLNLLNEKDFTFFV